MRYPENLKYSNDHEWVRVESDCCYIGITDFAQHALGEIVFVDIETVGETIDKNSVFGSIEAVKTVSEMYMPAPGTILEMNSELEDHPELINDDPYGTGWIITVNIDHPEQLDDLMNAEDYQKWTGK